MPGNLINIKVGGEIDPNLARSAKAGSDAINNLGRAASGATGPLNSMGAAAEHAFDEVGAGAAAMARISASIDDMAAAALRANQTFGVIGSSAAKAITPIATLEARLEELQAGISRSGTVQGAAFLGVQFDIVNRNLEHTKDLIQQATASAVGLSRAFNTVASASTSLNRLSPAIRPVLTDLKVIPPAANAAAASLNNFRKSGGQATATLTDFSRIIQDSPYGFVAIGNNLTQVADSFGNVVKSAGGVGPAFKAVFSSAAGFGGIGLAISLITTAITFAQVGLSNWTRGFGKNKEETEKARKELEEFLKTLKDVNTVAGSAASGIQGDVSQVRALAAVVQDTTQSYNVRKRALQELTQVNKNYFDGLKLEDAATGALAAKVDEYTKAIVAQAVVKGFTDEISRLSKELFTQEQATEKARLKMVQLEDQLAKTPKPGISSNALKQIGYAQLASDVDQAQKAFQEQRKATEDIATSQATLQGQLKKVNQEWLKYADTTKDASSKTKKEDEQIRSLKKELEGYQSQLSKLNKLREAGVLPLFQENDAFDLQRKIAETLKKIDDREVLLKIRPIPEIDPDIAELELQKALADLSTKTGSKLELKPVFRIRPTFETNQFSPATNLGAAIFPMEAITKMMQAIEFNIKLQQAELKKKIADSMRESVFNGIVDGIVGASSALGEAIGGILSGEGIGSALAAAGESILGIIGGVLQEVGKQIILTSTLVQALKKALAGLFTNPVAAIGVGIGLVALGGALKSIKFQGPKFADGVDNFGGGFAMVGERGPEIVRLPGGSDVIPNHALGATAMAISGSVRVRGSDLIIALERAYGNKNRMG